MNDDPEDSFYEGTHLKRVNFEKNEQIDNSAVDNSMISLQSNSKDQSMRSFRIKPTPAGKLSPPGNFKPGNRLYKRRAPVFKIGFTNPTWQNGSLRIIYYVSKFMSIMLTSVEKIKLKFVNRKLFKIIGDNSSFYDFYRSRNMVQDKPTLLDRLNGRFGSLAAPLNKCNNYCERVFSNLDIIFMPDNIFKIIFDAMFMLAVLCDIFYQSLRISFENNLQNQGEQYFFTQVLSYLFMLEVVLTFNTAFYSKGKIIINRKSIFKRYLKGYFFIDIFLIGLPYVTRSLIPEFQILRILRVYKIQNIFSNMELVYNLRERHAALLQLIRLIFLMVFSCHLLACAWHYIAIIEVDQFNHYSWLVEYDLHDQPWAIKYITALYWAVITTCTVGYGDITPQTAAERLFAIFVVLLSSVLFGYMISSIGSIMSQFKEQDDTYLNQISLINSYVKRHGLSQKLQLKVRLYFEYFLKQNNHDKQAADLLVNLPEQLNRDVKIEMFKWFIQRIKFVGVCFKEDVVEELCLRSEERIVRPQEMIARQGQTIDSVFIVLSGEIQSYIDREDKEQISLRKFRKGDVIGERCFLENSPLHYSLKAIKHSTLIQIRRATLDKILQTASVEDVQKFSMVCDNLLHNPSQKLIPSICEGCELSHSLLSCFLTFYQANKRKVIRTHNRSQVMERELKQRRNSKFSGFRKSRQDYLEIALAYALENDLMKEDEMCDQHLERVGFKEQIMKDCISERDEEDEEDDDEDSFEDGPGNASTNAIERKSNIIIQDPRRFSVIRKSFVFQQQSNVRSSIASVKKNSVLSKQSSFRSQLSQDKRYKKKFNIKGLIQAQSTLEQEEQPRLSITSITPINQPILIDVKPPDIKMIAEVEAQSQQANIRVPYEDLDKGEEFGFYFPSYNLSNVLTKLSNEQKRRSLVRNERYRLHGHRKKEFTILIQRKQLTLT